VHKVKYLQHRITGAVISSQHKAWNDTVRMAMLCDLVYGPYLRNAASSPRKLHIWMDNFKGHKTETLKEVFVQNNMVVQFLPPNMTYLLQVLDLVVNGPIKNHVRNLRANRIFEYMQVFRTLFNSELQKPFADRKLPTWKPPKPSLEECIQDVLALFMESGSFTTDRFKGMVQKSFVETGTAPDIGGIFTRYSETDTKGRFDKPPSGTVKKSEFPEQDALTADLLEEMFFAEEDDEAEPADSIID
jgi:hypothetical protein